MRWFDEPPCPAYDVVSEQPQRLLLEGPSSAQRVVGGATAAFGGLFAGVGLAVARLPVPAPLKVIPLAFTAAGSGLAALGVGTALAKASLEATREGLVLRWKLPARDERVLRLSRDELAALEVTTHAQESSSQLGGASHRVYEFRLNAVTRAGRAVALETFGTRTQAELRKQALERLLGAPRAAPKGE